MKEVHQHEACTAFLHDLLDFIVEKMFVLSPTKNHVHSKMGWLRRLRDTHVCEQFMAKWSNPPKGRAKIGEVVQFLAEINGKDNAYFEKPAPYSKKEVWFPKPIQTHTTITQGQDLTRSEIPFSHH